LRNVFVRRALRSSGYLRSDQIIAKVGERKRFRSLAVSIISEWRDVMEKFSVGDERFRLGDRVTLNDKNLRTEVRKIVGIVTEVIYPRRDWYLDLMFGRAMYFVTIEYNDITYRVPTMECDLLLAK